MRTKVLVCGDDSRSFLATARSLARHGIAVHAAPFDFSTAALNSNKLQGIHWLPYYINNGQEWLEKLRSIIESEHIDLLIPCDERTILPLDRHRAEFSQLCKLAIPSSDAIKILFDKHHTRELASSMGISLPEGKLLSALDTAKSLIDEWGLPLVVKPRKSFSLDALYSRSNVLILNDAKLIPSILDMLPADRFIVESFFAGFGVGFSVLANEGRILQAFQHERVHEADLTGGSSYRRAVPIDPNLEGTVGLILQNIQYTGLAMFEFRRNRASGEYVLLEINARPWGSLPFPVALGVDFPFFWFELLMYNKELPRVPYPTQVYSRNLSHDLNYLRHNMDRFKSQPWRAGWFCIKWLSGFWRYLLGQEVWDSLVFDDPRPGLAELKYGVKVAAKHTIKRVLPRTLRRWRAKRILTKACKQGGAILFVCSGNICRSPFAALQLKRFLDVPATARKLEIMSAGTLVLEGRLPPRTAILAGHERGVDMQLHRSRHLSAELAQSARIIIVFDELVRQAVIARYPDLKSVLSLADLCDEGHFEEIRDPIGQDAAAFRTTYGSITDCNREIAVALRAML